MLGARRAAARGRRLALANALGRSLSTRQAAQMEMEVVDRLRAIPDGLGIGDIVASGRVKVSCSAVGSDMSIGASPRSFAHCRT